MPTSQTAQQQATCKKRFCEDQFLRAVNRINKRFRVPKTMKRLTPNLLKQCMEGYCNPTCQGTMFEDGVKFPAALKRNILARKTTRKGDNKKLLRMIHEMRKSIFGTKKSVLKDGFYHKLNRTERNQLKKQGAISGCALGSLTLMKG